MRTQPSITTFELAAHDLMVAIAARDNFTTWLSQLAKRRATQYSDPSFGPQDPRYWADIARALAPIAPPEVMPMHGVIDNGATLEGGARGLRGLFTSTPSEKDRKRVLRVATLVARVVSIVKSADSTITDDEKRCEEMAMASFGLTDEELATARPTAGLTADQFELHGEVDVKLRREILRGAWQFALRESLAAPAEETLATLAAKLELADQNMEIKAQAQSILARLGATVAMAIELVRHAGDGLDTAVRDAAANELLHAAASPARAAVLRERIAQRPPVDFEYPGVLQKSQRLQSVALAWATLVSINPSYGWSMQLRARLAEAASAAGCSYEVDPGINEVDRYLLRVASESSEPIRTDDQHAAESEAGEPDARSETAGES